MRYYLKLFSTLLKINLEQELAYRTDTIINLLLMIMWTGWDLLSLSIVFANTASLGGWSLGELIALLGVFRLVHTLMSALGLAEHREVQHGDARRHARLHPAASPRRRSSLSPSRASSSGVWPTWCSPSR